jgi:hypothetical protein
MAYNLLGFRAKSIAPIKLMLEKKFKLFIIWVL